MGIPLYDIVLRNNLPTSQLPVVNQPAILSITQTSNQSICQPTIVFITCFSHRAPDQTQTHKQCFFHELMENTGGWVDVTVGSKQLTLNHLLGTIVSNGYQLLGTVV